MATDPFTDSSGGWPIPVLQTGMTFKDIGSTGLRQFGGFVREEFLPQLQGREASRVYREMLDNSSVVGSVVFAITQAMRKVEWRTQPASDKADAQEAAEFADSLRDDMSHTWEDFIVEVLSMLGYGYSIHEIVYKRRNGRRPYAGRALSKYDDGRIGIRRLPIRSQDTVLKWFFGQNGEILGVTQQPWVGALIDIPVQKMLLFRPAQHKNNPEGRSILRNAYRPYYFAKRLEEQEAIMFERLAGFPVIYLPSALIEAASAAQNGQPANPGASQALEAYKKMVTNVRVDEQMGAILPSDTYRDATGAPTSVRMYEFQLLTPQQGRSGVSGNEMIGRYKLDIMMTVMCDFLQLGHEVRGTNNLAVTKADMFFTAIEGWLNSIAGVLNRHLLPRIWGVNGLDPDLMPQYVPDLATRMDLDGLGTFIANLSAAGMPLFPDEELENFLRDAAGMPEITDEAAREAAIRAAQSDPEAMKKMLRHAMAQRIRRPRSAAA